MNARAWMGIGIVGALGIALAAGLLYVNSGSSPSTEPLAVPDAVPTEAQARPSPRTKAVPFKPDVASSEPGSANTPEGEIRSNATYAPDPRPVATSLQELSDEYEAGLDAQFDIDPNANGSDPEERDRSLRGQLLAVTGQVTGAAEAHLAYAKQAPRADAQVATDRAAELYDHLSTVIAAAPVPQGLPPAEVDIQRKVLRRLSDSHARKAASLRASSGAGK